MNDFVIKLGQAAAHSYLEKMAAGTGQHVGAAIQNAWNRNVNPVKMLKAENRMLAGADRMNTKVRPAAPGPAQARHDRLTDAYNTGARNAMGHSLP